MSLRLDRLRSWARPAAPFLVFGISFLLMLSPQVLRTWLAHRKLASKPSSPLASSGFDAVNQDAAIAYWSSENDRLALLVTKSTGVLAVASLTIAPTIQVATVDGFSRHLAVVASLYLVSAVVSGIAVNMPQRRATLSLIEASGDDAALHMLEAAAANEDLGIRLSNWVFAGTRDCIGAILCLLVAVLLGTLF